MPKSCENKKRIALAVQELNNAINALLDVEESNGKLWCELEWLVDSIEEQFEVSLFGCEDVANESTDEEQQA